LQEAADKALLLGGLNQRRCGRSLTRTIGQPTIYTVDYCSLLKELRVPVQANYWNSSGRFYEYRAQRFNASFASRETRRAKSGERNVNALL
jgi:hypothetical protein